MTRELAEEQREALTQPDPVRTSGKRAEEVAAA